jgi:hypothetical protein
MKTEVIQYQTLADSIKPLVDRKIIFNVTFDADQKSADYMQFSM